MKNDLILKDDLMVFVYLEKNKLLTKNIIGMFKTLIRNKHIKDIQNFIQKIELNCNLIFNIEYFEHNKHQYYNEINKNYSTYIKHGFKISINENLS